MSEEDEVCEDAYTCQTTRNTSLLSVSCVLSLNDREALLLSASKVP